MYCDGLKFFKIKFNESLFLNSYKNYDIISFLDEFDDFMEDNITYLNEIFNENQFDFFLNNITYLNNYFILQEILNSEMFLEQIDFNSKNLINYYDSLNELNFDSNNFNFIFFENSKIYNNIIYFLFNSTELFTIIFIYIFITFLFYSSILENLTSYVYFNNKYKNNFYKNRSFIEVLLKLRKKNSLFKFFQWVLRYNKFLKWHIDFFKPFPISKHLKAYGYKPGFGLKW